MKLNQVLLAKAAGLERLDPTVVTQLECYADRLTAANEKINLVSRSVDLPKEIENQIASSLALCRCFSPQPDSWVDIGSGGGFPVLPLAIIWSSTRFLAIEPIAKKAYFIERTAQDLGLKNLHVEAARVEEVIARDDRTWDVVSIKAVTELRQSLAWASRLLVMGGKLLTYKPHDLNLGDLDLATDYGFEVMESLNLKELIDIVDIRIVMCKKV